MGWKQELTALQVDNYTAVGIATKDFRQKKSKAMEMRFYWINDRIEQGQFWVFWKPGPENLGDYHSKHHLTENHIAFWHKYLHVTELSLLRGCVNLTVTVSPTARQSPTVNTTKRESQRAQLKNYLIVCLS